MRSQEKKDAGLVLDVALGMVARASGVPAPKWREVCGENAARLRADYADMVARVRASCGDDPVDMDMLRSLAVESCLWDALEDVELGQDALRAAMDALEDVGTDVPAASSFPRPCGEVLDDAAGISSSACIRAARAEVAAEDAARGRGDMPAALRAVVRAFLWESAAAGMLPSEVEATDIVDDVSGGVALAVEDWIEFHRLAGRPACSVCGSCESCVRAWLS